LPHVGVTSTLRRRPAPPRSRGAPCTLHKPSNDGVTSTLRRWPISLRDALHETLGTETRERPRRPRRHAAHLPAPKQALSPPALPAPLAFVSHCDTNRFVSASRRSLRMPLATSRRYAKSGFDQSRQNEGLSPAAGAVPHPTRWEPSHAARAEDCSGCPRSTARTRGSGARERLRRGSGRRRSRRSASSASRGRGR
jgi:hypothetical protein